MANFFTNPKQYINLLTTAEDCKNIFPRDQARYNWDFIGLTDSDWNFSLEWVTVIVDRVRFDSNNKPNFTNSLVTGYFEGGTLSFGTTQDIRIPADMYTGPILPASEINIPITIVNLQWLKNNGETVNRQILFIQNYEPGVSIGDPTLDDNFIAIEVAGLALNTATVILELIDSITVYEEAFRAKLICDVPNALAQTAYAKFYARSSTGTSFTLIHTSTWTTVSENLNVSEVSIQTYYAPGDSRNLPPDTYTIRGEWPGRRTWPLRVSNTLSLQVIDGVPLVVTLNPAPVTATITGTTITLTATANTASGYPVFTTTNIANTVTFSIQGTSTYAALPSTRIITTTTFVGNNITATATASLFISNDLVDIIPDTNTTYTLITATIVNNVFTGTALITRTYPLIVNWNFLRSSLIASGSTSTTLTVSTTRNFTVNLTPLTVEVNEYFGQGRIDNGNFNPNYAPTYATTSPPPSTPNIFNYQNPISAVFERVNTIFGTRIWTSRSPVIRAYISTSTILTNTTVTFKAVYTNSTNIVTTPSVVAIDNKYTVDLLSAPANNQLRFENLPTYIKPGDTFLLAGITWPVISFVTATNVVTTNNWSGVINPTSYFQTGVTFNVKDPSVNNTTQWQGYNYNTAGNWIVFGNNIQTQSGTGTYQTWIPGDRWRISVPWYMISTGFISTATYTWPDNPLYYYTFNALPQNLLIAGSELAEGSPYFVWKTPTSTNIGIRHYIRAINYDTNTVITWPGGDIANKGLIPKYQPILRWAYSPLENIDKIFYEPLVEPENIGQWAEFFNGDGSLLTATYVVTLGTNNTSPQIGQWETSSIYPNQKYQTLDVDTSGTYIDSLPSGTYQITANIDTSDLVKVLNNRINSSSATTLVVYDLYQPIISATAEDQIVNYQFKIKLFKPILGDVEYLENVQIRIYDGVTQIGQSSNWRYSLDSAEITITLPKSSISTLTNVTGFFPGTVRDGSIYSFLRWNSQWPRYTTSTFTFVPTAFSLEGFVTLSVPSQARHGETVNANVLVQVPNPPFPNVFPTPNGTITMLAEGGIPISNDIVLGQNQSEFERRYGGNRAIVPFIASGQGNTWSSMQVRARYNGDGTYPVALSSAATIQIVPNNSFSFTEGANYNTAVLTMGTVRCNSVGNQYIQTDVGIEGNLFITFKPGVLNSFVFDNFQILVGDNMVNDWPQPVPPNGASVAGSNRTISNGGASLRIFNISNVYFRPTYSGNTLTILWRYIFSSASGSNSLFYATWPLYFKIRTLKSLNALNSLDNVATFSTSVVYAVANQTRVTPGFSGTQF